MIRNTAVSRAHVALGRLASKPAYLGLKRLPFKRLAHNSTSKCGQYDYDLVVIGGGSAGYAAASRAWDLGATVLLVEQKWLGGAGVWDGALASKTLWQLSRRTRGFRELLRDSKSGLQYEGNYEDVKKLVLDAQTARAVQMMNQFEALHRGCLFDSFGRKVGGQVTLMCGKADLTGPNSVSVAVDGRELVGSRTRKHASETWEVGFHEITAKNILLATGSSPRSLPGTVTDGRRVMTSDDIFQLDKLPASICIVGAGVIGCEFAAIFSNFGQTRVHLVNERRKRLLPTEDLDVSNFINKQYRDEGIKVHNQCKLLSLDVRENEVEVTLGTINIDAHGKQEIIAQEPFTVERVLVSIGRTPNLDSLNLQAAGLKLSKRGSLEMEKIGSSRCAGVPSIHVAGDATLDIGLVSVAEMEARSAVEDMFVKDEAKKTAVSYDNVSSIMFLKPEVACVGMNEQEAVKMNIAHKVAVMGFDVIARGIINRPQHASEYLDSPSSEDMTGPKSQARRRAKEATRLERTGFVKMIVSASDDPNVPETLLGMRAAGEDASAIIEAAALVISNKLPVSVLENLLHPHPAITEAVQECARMVSGKSINKPHVFSSCYVRSFFPRQGEKEGVARVEIGGLTKGLVPSYGVEDYEL
eukprot:CFRG7393T1